MWMAFHVPAFCSADQALMNLHKKMFEIFGKLYKVIFPD